jgi:hypothetical protein
VTHPAGTSIGPTYADADRLTFVPFTPAQQRQLGRGGAGATEKIRSFVPRGFTLDHVANGGMYLRSTSGSYAPSGPTVAESDQVVAANQRKAADQKARVDKAFEVQHVWVDGQYVTLAPVVDAQGNLTGYTTTTVGGKTSRTLAVPSAFGALEVSQIDETTPFLMSHWQNGTPGTPGPVTGKPSAGGMFSNVFHSLATSGPGILTIGGGVAWLASLATKDHGAYEAMLQKLHDAGYLSDADLAEAAGHWSAAAGKAFALAARDTAVVNTTPAGRDTTLDEFLVSKAGAYAAGQGAGKAPYQPVQRSYTDPAAIKAAAKDQAAQLLGRQLTPAEEGELVGHFRSLEDAKFDQIDSAGRAGTAASVTDPSAPGQIDSFLDSGPREQEQADFRAAQMGQVIKRLFGVATGG